MTYTLAYDGTSRTWSTTVHARVLPGASGTAMPLTARCDVRDAAGPGWLASGRLTISQPQLIDGNRAVQFGATLRGVSVDELRRAGWRCALAVTVYVDVPTAALPGVPVPVSVPAITDTCVLDVEAPLEIEARHDGITSGPYAGQVYLYARVNAPAASPEELRVAFASLHFRSVTAGIETSAEEFAGDWKRVRVFWNAILGPGASPNPTVRITAHCQGRDLLLPYTVVLAGFTGQVVLTLSKPDLRLDGTDSLTATATVNVSGPRAADPRLVAQVLGSLAVTADTGWVVPSPGPGAVGSGTWTVRGLDARGVPAGPALPASAVLTARGSVGSTLFQGQATVTLTSGAPAARIEIHLPEPSLVIKPDGKDEFWVHARVVVDDPRGQQDPRLAAAQNTIGFSFADPAVQAWADLLPDTGGPSGVTVGGWRATCLVMADVLERIREFGPQHPPTDVPIRVTARFGTADLPEQRVTVRVLAVPVLTARPERVTLWAHRPAKPQIVVALRHHAEWGTGWRVEAAFLQKPVAALSPTAVTDPTGAVVFTLDGPTQTPPKGPRLADRSVSSTVRFTASQAGRVVDRVDVPVTVYRKGLFLYDDLPPGGRIPIRSDLGAGTPEERKTYVRFQLFLGEEHYDKSSIADLTFSDPEREDPDVDPAVGNELLRQVNTQQEFVDYSEDNTGIITRYALSTEKVLIQKPGGADPNNFDAHLVAYSEDPDCALELPLVYRLAPEKPPGSVEEEYEYCKHIIITYLPFDQVDPELEILLRNRGRWGARDLYDHRHLVWERARDQIYATGEIERLRAESADATIYWLGWVVWVGDICFTLVLNAVLPGAPLLRFVLPIFRDAVIGIFNAWLYAPAGKSTWDIVADYVWDLLIKNVGKRVGKQVIVDNVSGGVRNPLTWVLLAVFRLGYHKALSKDENGQPLGWIDAARRAAADLTADAAKAFFADWAKQKGAETGWTVVFEAVAEPI